MISRPRFSFNPNLDLYTIEPPVQIGAKWAQTYPLSKSPFREPNLVSSFPLLNLAQGVPGHPPTKEFLDQICHQMLTPNCPPAVGHSHGYGPVFGDAALRKAVADDINRFYRSENESAKGARNQVDMQEVAITAGCNLAFAATAMSIASSGDALLVPTPWYFNHSMTLSSLGIECIPLPTRSPRFFPEPDQIRKHLEKSQREECASIKGVILVTPNNPTGAIYPPQLIHEIASICREHSVALILDETYRDFVLADDSEHVPIGTDDCATLPAPKACPPFGRPHNLFQESGSGIMDWDWRQTVIHLFSFSKSYAIPGHRLGGIVAHPAFLQQNITNERGEEKLFFGPVAKALDNLQVAPPRTDTQRAVAWATHTPSQIEWRLNVARQLREKRLAFIEGLEKKIDQKLNSEGQLLGPGNIPTEPAKSPQEWRWQVESAGAYYAFLRHPFNLLTSEKVAEGLAGLVGVVLLPGSFFMPLAKHDDIGLMDSRSRLRVSIANVSNEKLADLPERLAILSELWHKQGQGWGV